jgi:pimeloyl-ACP methyl ester carboxylesterase
MRSISIPTMIVWGADDQVFSMDNATRLQSDIENSKAAVIEDSGHLPQLEQTEAFLAAIRPFLKQTGSSQ